MARVSSGKSPARSARASRNTRALCFVSAMSSTSRSISPSALLGHGPPRLGLHVIESGLGLDRDRHVGRPQDEVEGTRVTTHHPHLDVPRPDRGEANPEPIEERQLPPVPYRRAGRIRAQAQLETRCSGQSGDADAIDAADEPALDPADLTRREAGRTAHAFHRQTRDVTRRPELFAEAQQRAPHAQGRPVRRPLIRGHRRQGARHGLSAAHSDRPAHSPGPGDPLLRPAATATEEPAFHRWLVHRAHDPTVERGFWGLARPLLRRCERWMQSRRIEPGR